MTAVNKSASNLYRRDSVFYFVFNVPPDIRPFVKRCQFRYSLGTRQVSLARHRASYVGFRCRDLCRKIRVGGMNALEDSDISGLVQQWLQESLETMEDNRVDGPVQSEAGVGEVVSDLQKAEASYRSALGRSDYNFVERQAEMILEERGLSFERDSHAFRKLCRELMKASIRHIQIEQERSKGEYDDLPEPGNSVAIPAIASQEPQSNVIFISISKLFDGYEQEMLAGKRWRDKTRLENRAMADTLVDILGDLPVNTLDKAKAREYKSSLQKIPPNRHKVKRYKGKTIAEILSMPNVDTVSVTTVNNHLIKISGLFRWAVDQGYVSSNPFENLTIPTSSRAKDDVLPFDKTDLEKIFGSPLYRDNSFQHAYQFWIPLVGLFSGARIEEICQLHLEDVKQVDGIWCLDVNDGPGRSLKSKSSRRIVPVHLELIRLGFLQYADMQRAAGKAQLFPELGRTRGKYSHGASLWFGRLKRSLGFPLRKKTFHSFRHTMTSKLREIRAQDHEIKMLLGHETGSVTHDVYGGREVKPLFEVLKQVDFGVDLAHLKFKR